MICSIRLQILLWGSREPLLFLNPSSPFSLLRPRCSKKGEEDAAPLTDRSAGTYESEGLEIPGAHLLILAVPNEEFLFSKDPRISFFKGSAQAGQGRFSEQSAPGVHPTG